jgi:hypothetical protein
VADKYDILTISQEIAVVSPTATLEVSRVGFTTKPSGVIAYVNVPKKNQTAAQVANTVDQYALLIELMMAYQGVSGAYFAQDVDKAGLLADYLVVIVEYDSTDVSRPGPFQTEVWTKMVSYGNATGYAHSGVKDAIGKAYAELQTVVDG